MEHTLNADGINKAALLLMTLGAVLQDFIDQAQIHIARCRLTRTHTFARCSTRRSATTRLEASSTTPAFTALRRPFYGQDSFDCSQRQICYVLRRARPQLPRTRWLPRIR